MTPARHVMILASAGSGKTYALTTRFVALLAAGAPAERIVALTFTRKAAGEFFDEILHKLARAARDEPAARSLAREIAAANGFPDAAALGTQDFLRLLRQVVDAMHRLRLGTLDSFFARIARAFPLELGLTGEFEILQEHAARLERQRVLRRMFARTGPALEGAQTEFIEAFKRATFGAEEKQLGARLDAFLDEHQETFLAAPLAAAWGDPDRIWPAGSPWLAPEIKLADAGRDLRAALGAMSDGQRARWENFFAGLEEWTPGAPLPAPVEYILKNALAVWPDLTGGAAEITIDRRKLPLPPGACRALERIITHLVGAELRRRIETTRGIFAVLRSYEANYHDAVRRAGRLTFADVQRLLAPESSGTLLSADVTSGKHHLPGAPEPEGPEAGGQLPDTPPLVLPGADTAGERRLLLDYRLDAEIDHWLLDEFQDTSFGQWSILRNLIDEVVQDPEQRRSFFCVGDVKQAIYAWREGDPRLFREIFNHYNQAAPGSIAERHLVDSWRSGPALIEMVNAVFGRAPTIAELFPGEASETWNREWRDHRSALPQRTGQAALLLAADEGERWATVRRLIEEIRPLDRGLTCAVLVKKNATATALADFLRHAGIPAMAESDLQIAIDNPLGAALLALVQAAAHPGDTLAQEHVRMSPLGAILRDRGLDTSEALTGAVLGGVHADGFERALAPWITALEARLEPDDAFTRLRARQFAAAAGVFDATGSRDLGEFIAFMERYPVRPPESAAVVRVMTVHKAKGLGFDVVLLPDLEGNRIDERREGLAVRKAADRSIAWVLDLPPKLFCAQDDVLAAYLRAAEADACYENLSLLYVALTRAKRAMYVVTEPVGTSKSRNFPRLLADTLGHEAAEVRVGAARFSGVWSAGDPDWHGPIMSPSAADSSSVSAQLEPLAAGAGVRVVRREARRPSAERDGAIAAGRLFALDASGATDFGTALHELLAGVEWVRFAAPRRGSTAAERTPPTADAIVGQWRARPIAASDPAVLAAAERCLLAPELRDVWQPPRDGAAAEVWRERSFEVVLDGAWITGVFDRVVVGRDAAGRAIEARVFDFKTDRLGREDDVETVRARYAEQLNLYRRVAAILAGLPTEKVGAELVLTQAGRRVPVPWIAH